MEEKTLGKTIAELRKAKGMTQLELAEKMCVTDKAVSKWERDLSYPDLNTIPKLAELFSISVDELMQVKRTAPEKAEEKKLPELVNLIFRAVALAMGVGVFVLSILKELDLEGGISMLAIAVICLSLSTFTKKPE